MGFSLTNLVNLAHFSYMHVLDVCKLTLSYCYLFFIFFIYSFNFKRLVSVCHWLIPHFVMHLA